MKTCSTCKLDKELSEFGKQTKNKDGHQGKCKSCMAAYHRAWYLDPENGKSKKDGQRRLNATYRQEWRQKMDELKAKPCTDCGGCFPPECMDFDHLPGNEKAYLISRMNHAPEDKLEAELAKCQLVCANCHRIRTKKRISG